MWILSPDDQPIQLTHSEEQARLKENEISKRKCLEQAFELTSRPIKLCDLAHEEGKRSNDEVGTLILIQDSAVIGPTADFYPECDVQHFGCPHALGRNLWLQNGIVMQWLEKTNTALHYIMLQNGEYLVKLDKEMREARVGQRGHWQNREQAKENEKPVLVKYRMFMKEIEPYRIRLHLLLAKELGKEPVMQAA